MMDTVAVIGAGGFTGRACVETLLARGIHVRAVARDPERCRAAFRTQPSLTGTTVQADELEVVAGDVTDVASLRAALAGCTAAIFTATSSGWMQLRSFWRTMRTTSPQAVDHMGVRNAAQVARELGLRHFVLVSAITATPKQRRTVAGLIVNYCLRWGLMDAKWQGEQALRASGVPYTIIRPDYITKPPAQPTRLIVQQGDPPPTALRHTSVADLAAMCVAALGDPAARNVTLELFSETVKAGAEAPPSREALVAAAFRGLAADESAAG